MKNEVIENPETNPNKNLPRYTIDWSKKANRNVERQQSAYMKKHGKLINKGAIACKLLETATL